MQTPEQQYFDFLERLGGTPRFSDKELADLKTHFKKGAKKIKVTETGEDGKQYERTEMRWEAERMVRTTTGLSSNPRLSY